MQRGEVLSQMNVALPYAGHSLSEPQYSRLEDPRTGEPGGLPSMGLHRVGYD